MFKLDKEKRFVLYWNERYHEGPKTKIANEDFFTEDRGYEQDREIKDINDLNLGEKKVFGPDPGGAIHIVLRVL